MLHLLLTLALTAADPAQPAIFYVQHDDAVTRAVVQAEAERQHPGRPVLVVLLADDEAPADAGLPGLDAPTYRHLLTATIKAFERRHPGAAHQCLGGASQQVLRAACLGARATLQQELPFVPWNIGVVDVTAPSVVDSPAHL